MAQEILYNGQCPICSTEIEHYRAQAETAGAPMRFTDLNDADLVQWGLSTEDAARRLHVRQPDGSIVSGLAAFIVLWRELPRLRWLARVASLPLVRPMAHWGYERVAAPLLFWMHQRRQAKRTQV